MPSPWTDSSFAARLPGRVRVSPPDVSLDARDLAAPGGELLRPIQTEEVADAGEDRAPGGGEETPVFTPSAVSPADGLAIPAGLAPESRSPFVAES